MFPLGSELAQVPKFQDRVVTETRILLSTIPLPLPRIWRVCIACSLRDKSLGQWAAHPGRGQPGYLEGRPPLFWLRRSAEKDRLCYCTVKATAPTVALTEPDVPVIVIV